MSTYNSGKVALLSARGATLSANVWKLPRPMGLAIQDDLLAIAARHHVLVYELTANCPADLAQCRLKAAYHTGRLDAHDLAFDSQGLLFANTRFNCAARPSDRVHFARTWQPWFVARSVRRDSCHLNGIGVRDGRLAMATAFCQCGVPAGWRTAERFTSGILIDVQGEQIAVNGLNMPHSPRWHESRWWFCNSGEGAVCTFAPGRAGVEEVAALAGFTRGLTFAHGRAAVGLSRIRRRHILDAPPVRQRWPALRAGVAIIDPASGAETGGVEFVRGGREVYDVAFIPERP